MSGLDAVATALVVVVVGYPAVRWTAQTLIVCVGLPVSAVVWTAVGPWAGWSVLGLTVLAVYAWSGGRGRKHVTKPALRALADSPRARGWLVFLSSAVATVLAPAARWALGALLVAVASAAWLMWGLVRPPAPRRRRVARPVPLGNRDRSLSESGPCPSCGGLMTAHLSEDGLSGKAQCDHCGGRWVTVSDAAQGGQLVWVPLPDAGRRAEGVA